MLILIGILPAHYAVNVNLDLAQINEVDAEVQRIDALLSRFSMNGDAASIRQELRQIGATLASKQSLADLPAQERSALRASILGVDERLGEFEVTQGLGLPVSTTHVLSSGVAGTMAANQSDLQLKTVRAIAIAWLLTLPVTMLLSGTLFSITARSSMKEISKRAIVQPRKERVLRKLE